MFPGFRLWVRETYPNGVDWEEVMADDSDRYDMPEQPPLSQLSPGPADLELSQATSSPDY